MAYEQRIKELQERIKSLKQKKEKELLETSPSQSFIADINDSIEGCKRELNFLAKNPGGVQMVNGV